MINQGATLALLLLATDLHGSGASGEEWRGVHRHRQGAIASQKPIGPDQKYLAEKTLSAGIQPASYSWEGDFSRGAQVVLHLEHGVNLSLQNEQQTFRFDQRQVQGRLTSIKVGKLYQNDFALSLGIGHRTLNASKSERLLSNRMADTTISTESLGWYFNLGYVWHWPVFMMSLDFLSYYSPFKYTGEKSFGIVSVTEADRKIARDQIESFGLRPSLEMLKFQISFSI